MRATERSRALVVSLFLLAATGVAQTSNETSFVPLLPIGGAYWKDTIEIGLALHPTRNRIYTVAMATTGFELIHRDSIAGGLVAADTTAWQSYWSVIDLEVWGEADEALIAWGRFPNPSRTRTRKEGVGLERIDVLTGSSQGVDHGVRFLAFDVDQETGTAWGISENDTRTNYAITSLDLATGMTSSSDISLPTAEAIIRDLVLDATHSVLYSFFQDSEFPDDPDSIEPGGFVLAHSLPSGTLLGRADIADGNYRAGGMDLDVQRGALFVIPFEAGGSIRRINVASMTVDATIEESDVAPGYATRGSLAVHTPTGNIFITNNTEYQIDQRVIMLDPEGPAVVRSWAAGAEPSPLAYDPRLDRLFAASFFSQSITFIDPQRIPELFRDPISIVPYDFYFDEANDRLLLLSEGMEMYAMEAENGRLTDRVDTFGLVPDVRIVPDPVFNRYFVGVFGRSSPAVFDAAGLSRLGNFPLGGRAIAVSQQHRLVFHAEPFLYPSGSILITAATDGSLIRQVPASDLFGDTRVLAVDDARNLLYGVSANRNQGRSFGLYVFDWITDASKDLVLPPAPSIYWNPFEHPAVHPVTGKIAVVGYSGPVHLLIYQSKDDASPDVFQLSDLYWASDLMIDQINNEVVVLGAGGAEFNAILYRANLEGTPSLERLELDLPLPPEYMAFDYVRGSLWLAARSPSGMYRLPWPPDRPSGKPARVASINLAAESLPGRIRLHWSIDPQPEPGDVIQILRQDGELAASFLGHRIR